MISFVIPTLNEEKVIRKTRECLKSYSGKSEIIVSDGKSRDKTIEITRQFTDKVAVYEGVKRQTIADGKNAGAALAAGDFLVFLDADVTIPDINPFFEKAFKIFQDDQRLMGLTVFYKVLPEMATLTDKIIFLALGHYFSFVNNILGLGVSGGEFQMVKTEFFRKIGGFNKELAVAEDAELFWRIAKTHYRTRCERKLFIYHTGRRAHKIGWPKLLAQWCLNPIKAALFKKFKKKEMEEWVEIR